MSTKERLDVALVARGLAETRAKAQENKALENKAQENEKKEGK